MKLTFVVPNLYLSGGIKSTIAMARAMAERGHDVRLTVPVVPGRDGQPWYRPRRTAVQLVRAAQNLFGLHGWIGEQNIPLRWLPWNSPRFLPDADILVLTWWHDVATFAGAPATKGTKVHFVRSVELWGGPRETVLAAYRTDMPKVATTIALRDSLLKVTGAQCRAIIPNGLDPYYLDQPLYPCRTTGVPRIGVLYRLQDWKRMDDAFAVLERVAGECPAQVVIFGEPMRAQHRRIAAHLPGIEVHTRPHGPRLVELYRSLDLFLFTSDETEAFGNPPFEALACGTAVVTTDVGAVPEYLRDGVDARVVAPGDVEGMTASVLELLRDPAQRKTLATTGQRTAQTLDWGRAAERFDGFLCEILAEQRGGRAQ